MDLVYFQSISLSENFKSEAQTINFSENCVLKNTKAVRGFLQTYNTPAIALCLLIIISKTNPSSVDISSK